ncbi:hypothetical protein [Cupriavidus respiraculi]|nr:hypothetical protein [Cupriavidus respiraculi]MBY4946832.1 hypothetical protein [Cupriavidus respiraculi]
MVGKISGEGSKRATGRSGMSAAGGSKASEKGRKPRATENDDLAARLIRCLANVGGVRLKFKKTIPIYYADAKRPWLVVRELGKRKETGRITKKGRFVKVP